MWEVIFMLRFIFQFCIASGVFLFAFLAAWYEGSVLLNRPSEWRNSTPITQWLVGHVHESSDILLWDFFVYAAQYRPTFPMIMTVSGLYLLILIGNLLFKKVRKWFAYYLIMISVGLFVLGYFSYESLTDGGQKMFGLFTACGSFCLLAGLITYLTVTIRIKRMKTE